LISFLRDLYVRIPGGYADNRLNNAYWYGGFPLLYETLNVNFGVSVDRGIEVDFDGFTALIDLIGGVDVTLTAAEASVVGGGAAEGVCHLNGRQALAFSRIRKLDNDFNRTGRQRAVLEAVFQKLREADLATLLKLLDAALPMITTDMTDSELMSLAVKLASLSGELQIRGHLIPASDSYRFARIREMEVLLPDAARIQRHLQEDYLPFDR
ncbi:MAG: LCP family protein, partial [Oscillospiraceae bacterium]|nr:LCP family protein [Oscillospiraceae bacterium]